MKNQYKKSIIFFALIFTIGFGLISFPKISLGENITSDGKYTVLAPLPCIEGSGIECNGPNGGVQERVDFKTYVQYTFNLLIGLSAVTAVILIVWSGIQYIVSTSILNKQSSLDRAKNALIGLVLILTSFIILRTVDPRFTEIPNTLVPKIEISSFLANDSYSKLIESIDNDTKDQVRKGIEIGKEMEKAREDANAKLEAFKKTDEALKEAIKNASTSEDQKRITEIQTQKQKDLDQVNLSLTNKAMIGARQDMNGQVLSSLRRMEEVTSGLGKDNNDYYQALSAYKLIITQLKSDKENIATMLTNRESELTYLGQLDHSELKDLANAADAKISIYQLDTVIRSASRVITPEEGKYIEFINMDGEQVKKFDGAKNNSVRDTVSYIQGQISSIEQQIDGVANQQSKDDLKILLNKAKDELNSKNILNIK